MTAALSTQAKAQVLAEALPWLTQLHGKIVVVKYGGNAMTNDTVLLLASGASEIAPSQADLDDAVLRVCADLCAQLQAAAEGVTKTGWQ